MEFRRGKFIEKEDMIGTKYKLVEYINNDLAISCIEIDEKIFPVRYNYYEPIEFLDLFLNDECIWDYCKFDLEYFIQNYL